MRGENMSDALSYIVYGLYGIILNELIWVFRYTLKVTKNEGEKNEKKARKTGQGAFRVII